jgi:hypothetical protein
MPEVVVKPADGGVRIGHTVLAGVMNIPVQPRGAAAACTAERLPFGEESSFRPRNEPDYEIDVKILQTLSTGRELM